MTAGGASISRSTTRGADSWSADWRDFLLGFLGAKASKRSRYYQSVADVSTTSTGTKYRDLPEKHPHLQRKVLTKGFQKTVKMVSKQDYSKELHKDENKEPTNWNWHKPSKIVQNDNILTVSSRKNTDISTRKPSAILLEPYCNQWLTNCNPTGGGLLL